MELPILFTLVTSFIVITSSHPKNSAPFCIYSFNFLGTPYCLNKDLPNCIDIIPKDYYKRQILQPIPGYIPVYIKADGEPLVRRENKKPLVNVHPQKAAEFKEKNISKYPEKISSENSDEKPGTKTGRDEIKTSKTVSSELQEKAELVTEKLTPNENSAKADSFKIKMQSVP